MASQWWIAVLSYVVLFIMMKDGESAVPAGNLEVRVARLEEKVKALEEVCMDRCKRKYTHKESFSILGRTFAKETLIYYYSRLKKFFNSIASGHFY